MGFVLGMRILLFNKVGGRASGLSNVLLILSKSTLNPFGASTCPPEGQGGSN